MDKIKSTMHVPLMCGQSPVHNNRLHVAAKSREEQLGDLSENCNIIMMMCRSSYTAYVQNASSEVASGVELVRQ